MAAGQLPVVSQETKRTQRSNTVYLIHVEGQIRGMVEDTYQRTYETNKRPSSMEDARAIANDDFLRVTKLHAEEIITVKTLLF